MQAFTASSKTTGLQKHVLVCVIAGIYPTKDRLKAWGYDVNVVCEHDSEVDSVQHRVMDCTGVCTPAPKADSELRDIWDSEFRAILVPVRPYFDVWPVGGRAVYKVGDDFVEAHPPLAKVLTVISHSGAPRGQKANGMRPIQLSLARA